MFNGLSTVEGQRRGVYATLGRIVSYVMHPLFVPVYAVCVLLYGDTVLMRIDAGIKLYFMAVIILNVVVVPVAAILLLRVFNLVGDLSLCSRRDRILPLLVVSIGYLVCALMLRDLYIAAMIRKFLLSAFGCVAVAVVVTVFRRISLHLTACGGMTAIFVIITVSGMGDITWALVAGALLTGALASARLYLGRHNTAQVAAGFAAGFITASSVILFL